MIEEGFLKKHGPFVYILIGTILFWLSLKFNNIAKTTVDIPINYEIPHGYILPDHTVKKIEAVVEGKIYNLIRLNTYKGITLSLKSEQSQLINSNELTQKVKSLLQNRASLLSLPVNQLNLDLERAARKKVPIWTNNIRITPGSYKNLISPIRLFPDSVEISGAENDIANIDHWETEAYSIDQLESDLADETVLLTSEHNKENIALDINEVKMSVQVDRLIEKVLTCPVSQAENVKTLPAVVEMNVSYASRISSDVHCRNVNINLLDIDTSKLYKTIEVSPNITYLSLLSTSVDTVSVIKMDD